MNLLTLRGFGRPGIEFFHTNEGQLTENTFQKPFFLLQLVSQRSFLCVFDFESQFRKMAFKYLLHHFGFFSCECNVDHEGNSFQHAF